MFLILTSMASVVLARFIPFIHGEYNDPRNFQGRGIITVLHLLCQTVREEMAIVDIRVVFFSGWDRSFFTACPRVVTLTAPQTSAVFISVFTTTVRFIRCRQHSRQQPP